MQVGCILEERVIWYRNASKADKDCSLFSVITTSIPSNYAHVYDVLERSFHLFLGIEQVNLDFETEADMIRKFQVGLALQPVSV
jgi:hypothetical protein